MLTVIFVISAAVLAGSIFRRPTAFWQRAIVVLAAIMLIAVLVAWGIEYMMQSGTAGVPPALRNASFAQVAVEIHEERAGRPRSQTALALYVER